MDVRDMMEMKKQDPVSLLDGLDEKDRLALGMACALRVAVPLDVLPPHGKSVIPSDVSHYTAITPDARA